MLDVGQSIPSVLSEEAAFLNLEDLVDHARTELRWRRTASSLDGAGERTRRLVAKVEGHFLNCSRRAQFQEFFGSLDKHLFPKLAKRPSGGGADNFLERSPADAQFPRKVLKEARGSVAKVMRNGFHEQLLFVRHSDP